VILPPEASSPIFCFNWFIKEATPTSATRKACRRWLQDTSKQKLADFFIVFVPPALPVSPGSPEVDPTIDQNKRPG